MMVVIETIEELEKFKDDSMWCVCGQLMTGAHMSGCSKLRKLEKKLREKNDGN